MLIFDPPQCLTDPLDTYQETDLCHGRIETRRLSASTALNDYSDWPGLKQVFKVERETIFKKRGEIRQQGVYGMTSLSVEPVPPSQLLTQVTEHWSLENQSHWVRDVT